MQIDLTTQARPLNQYPLYWAECFGTAPFLPTSREEMDRLGWDSCDVIVVTGDAYVDHPSFGMAIIGRLLEAQGFRVGIIAQPDWQSAEPFAALGKPNLFFGVTAGNMDSMINRYTADRKIRSDDAYSPDGISSAASKLRCAASRITITGRTRYDVRFFRMPKPICCYTAMRNEPSSRLHIAWHAVIRLNPYPMFAARLFLSRISPRTGR